MRTPADTARGRGARGIALALVVGLAWFGAAGRGGDRRAPGETHVAAHDASRGAAPRRDGAGDGGDARAQPAAQPAAIARSELALTRADDAVQAHARDCWQRRAPLRTAPGQRDETTQSIRLELGVLLEAGVGRIVRTQVSDDAMLDLSLRGCILDGLGALRWPSPGADGPATVRTVLRAGRLALPAGPPDRAPAALASARLPLPPAPLPLAPPRSAPW